MRKTILTASIAALIAGAALTGTAFAKSSAGIGGGDMAIEHIIRALDLDAAQRTEVRRIADEARPQARAIADSKRASRKQLRELITAETLDQTALRTLANAQGDNAAAAIVIRAQAMHEIRRILTAEQLEKLDSLRQQRRDSQRRRR